MNNMAERQNKIEIVYEYLDLIEKEVIIRIPDSPTIKDTILHLLERGLIPPKKVRNYMIIHDFDKFLVSNEGNRTHTFMDISIKYEITERQAQTIVYKDRSKHMPTYNVSY
jgi:hypothetical protein|tara:strand:- start:1071 stop:1403 length:333 start_codon:yes stop_codon:yes gene_type:complete